MTNFDTWEETDAALRAIKKIILLLHETRPSEKSKDEALKKVFEDELKEIRKFAISVHERRIRLNLERNRNV